jgi:hypothetical protein
MSAFGLGADMWLAAGQSTKQPPVLSTALTFGRDVVRDCQCRDCQRESGTGHGSHLTFLREGVKLTGEGR